MKLHILAAAVGLLLAPCAAFAHGTPPAPAHGGQVAEDSAEHWVELVISGDTLTVWVLDENRKPVPAAQLGGKATVLVSGKSQAVVLSPGDANSLTGKLPGAVAGKTTTVLSLTVSGKTAQARFASAQ
jgi:hypothetical protein